MASVLADGQVRPPLSRLPKHGEVYKLSTNRRWAFSSVATVTFTGRSISLTSFVMAMAASSW